MSAAVLDSKTLLGAISPGQAVDAVADAFEHHARGDWRMPAKLYVDAPPHGDFRAMPASGGGLAIVKWATSFPRNPGRELPVVAGAVLVSDAETGALLAILDCAAVTSLRTGAAAAVSVRTLAREDAGAVGLIGCGANGAWAGRCLKAIGYEAGVCADTRAENSTKVAAELGWTAGARAEAAAQDIVVTVTPGEQPVILDADLRAGQHLSVLGADAHGKSEVELAALARMRIFCDEWSQASAGGELTAAVGSGLVKRGDVIQLGHVLTGEAEGRCSAEEITLFDSTGLAIQDLAIARVAIDLVESGAIEPDFVDL